MCLKHCGASCDGNRAKSLIFHAIREAPSPMPQHAGRCGPGTEANGSGANPERLWTANTRKASCLERTTRPRAPVLVPARAGVTRRARARREHVTGRVGVGFLILSIAPGGRGSC